MVQWVGTLTRFWIALHDPKMVTFWTSFWSIWGSKTGRYRSKSGSKNGHSGVYLKWSIFWSKLETFRLGTLRARAGIHRVAVLILYTNKGTLSWRPIVMVECMRSKKWQKGVVFDENRYHLIRENYGFLIFGCVKKWPFLGVGLCVGPHGILRQDRGNPSILS